MNKTEKIFLPKAPQGQEPDVFVGVNGKGWRIARGLEVEVPAAVAEVLRNAEAADAVTERFLRGGVAGPR